MKRATIKQSMKCTVNSSPRNCTFASVNFVITGLDNGSSPVQRHAITETSGDFWSKHGQEQSSVKSVIQGHMKYHRYEQRII